MICSIFLDLGSLYAVLMMVSNEYIRLVGVPGFRLDFIQSLDGAWSRTK